MVDAKSTVDRSPASTNSCTLSVRVEPRRAASWSALRRALSAQRNGGITRTLEKPVMQKVFSDVDAPSKSVVRNEGSSKEEWHAMIKWLAKINREMEAAEVERHAKRGDNALP